MTTDQQIAEAREKFPKGAYRAGSSFAWVPFTGDPNARFGCVDGVDYLPLDSDEPCSNCLGSGKHGWGRCTLCHGPGKADSIIQRIRTGKWQPQPCKRCGGERRVAIKGRAVATKPCPDCGTGQAPEGRSEA